MSHLASESTEINLSACPDCMGTGDSEVEGVKGPLPCDACNGSGSDLGALERRRQGRTRFVKADRARGKLAELLDSGRNEREVANLVGCSPSTVKALLGGAQSHIQYATEQRILTATDRTTEQ